MIFRDLKLPFREFTHKRRRHWTHATGGKTCHRRKDKAAASGEGDTGEDPEVFLANYKKAAKIFGGEVSNEILDGISGAGRMG